MIESQQRALLYKNCMYCTRQYFLVYYRLVDSVVTIRLTARGSITDKQLRYYRDIVTISATEHLGHWQKPFQILTGNHPFLSGNDTQSI